VGLHALTCVLVVAFSPDELVGVVEALLLGVEIIEPLEGVDSDDNVSSTSVRLASKVTLLQVVENSGL
jgi:hypothetical protein